MSGYCLADVEPFAECECLLDGHRGIYIPQNFAENHGEAWGVSEEDRSILLAGPDHEFYWDTWSDVLDTATLQYNGKTWHLHQDSDLFAVVYRDTE